MSTENTHSFWPLTHKLYKSSNINFTPKYGYVLFIFIIHENETDEFKELLLLLPCDQEEGVSNTLEMPPIKKNIYIKGVVQLIYPIFFVFIGRDLMVLFIIAKIHIIKIKGTNLWRCQMGQY